MKKNFKKFASMMLALVMAISLAAPAFAAPAAEEPAADIAVTLKLVDEDGNNIYPAGSGVVSATLPAGKTVYDLVTKYLPAGTSSVWNTSGNSKFLQNINYNGKDYPTAPLTDAPDVLDDEDNPIAFLAWKEGYGLISYGATGYEYYYAGDAWTYNVDGNIGEQNANELAMNEFVLGNNNTVVLTYAEQTSQWTQSKPLSKTYPFLPEASADTDITVTLQLVGKDGDIVAPTQMTLPTGSTAYDLVTKYFAQTDNSAVVNRSAWNISGDSKFLQSIMYDGTVYATEPLTDEPTDVKDEDGNPITFEAWRNGYGLISYGTNSYEYYYAGNAWTYNVKEGITGGQDVNVLAMNEFILHDDNIVTLTYAEQTSQWTQDYPLSNTYPFLPV